MADSDQNRRIIGLIMLGLLAWGVFIAIGAVVYNRAPGRAAMVLACIFVFMGFWGAMLALRHRSNRRENDGDER